MLSSGKHIIESRLPLERDPPIATAPPRFGRGTHDDVTDEAHEAQLSLRDENLASIAHDLRHPLMIISLEAMRLADELANAADRRSARRIAQNADFMERMIENLLDLTHAEAGRLRLRLLLVELSDVIKGVLDRSIAGADRDRIKLDVRDTVVVRIDQARIERVLENLIGNAIKYTPDRSPIAVRLDTRGARAQVSVSDSGPGLTAEQARRAFERHWQAQPHQGHGLGLHLARMIVEAHGGRIGVETATGRGARFFFELPIVR